MRDIKTANDRAENEERRADDLERKLTLTQEQLDSLEEKIAADNHAEQLQQAVIRAETAERKVADLENQLEESEDKVREAEEKAEAANNQLQEMLRELGIE